MHPIMFDRPLYVRDGQRTIHELDTLSDALTFLQNWPQGRRGPIFQSAVRACEAALRGGLHLEGARNAVKCFARSAGVLEQAPIAVEPWMIGVRRGRGGLQT